MGMPIDLGIYELCLSKIHFSDTMLKAEKYKSYSKHI